MKEPIYVVVLLIEEYQVKDKTVTPASIFPGAKHKIYILSAFQSNTQISQNNGWHKKVIGGNKTMVLYGTDKYSTPILNI